MSLHLILLTHVSPSLHHLVVSTAMTNGDFGPLSPPAAVSLPLLWSFSKRALSTTPLRLGRSRSRLTITRWPRRKSCSSFGESLQCVIFPFPSPFWVIAL